jgi:hypothetical protein
VLARQACLKLCSHALRTDCLVLRMQGACMLPMRAMHAGAVAATEPHRSCVLPQYPSLLMCST